MKLFKSLKMLSNCVVWKKKLFLHFEPCIDVVLVLEETLPQDLVACLVDFQDGDEC